MKQEIHNDMRFMGEVPLEVDTDPEVFYHPSAEARAVALRKRHTQYFSQTNKEKLIMKQEIQIAVTFTGEVEVELDGYLVGIQLRDALYQFLESPEAKGLAFAITEQPKVEHIKGEAQIYGTDEDK